MVARCDVSERRDVTNIDCREKLPTSSFYPSLILSFHSSIFSFSLSTPLLLKSLSVSCCLGVGLTM